MSLVKWFRRNNTKIMAVVVIVLMIGFIGGSALTYLLQGSRGLKDAVATVAGRKITNQDLFQAREELELLWMLRADDLLRAQDLQGVLLAELLFAGERRASPELINRIRQTIRRNLYAISDKQINDLYRGHLPPHIHWYCLKDEARRAGIGISDSQAGELLGRVIPQLFNGQTYSQLIGAMIDKQRIPEAQILATVGQLLSVLQYGQMMCSDQGLTARQIMNEAGIEQERIDVEFVEFDADVFVDPCAPGPSEDEIAKHFDKYKAFFAGAVSDENPYGFGYKLPARVSLEYIVVKLDDVRRIVTLPTQDEVGDYYSRNKAQVFTEQVPSDPNDPNSPLTEHVKSYAEVAGSIAKQLLADKINSRADSILQEARTLTEESEAGGTRDEGAGTKDEQSDYVAVARQLSEKHKIKVYAGRTGLLSAADMQKDESLGGLFLRGYGANPVALSRVVLAVDGLGVSELGPFDVPVPKLRENIGPLKDPFGAGGLMAIVRVIEAQKAAAPESVEQTYSTRCLELDPNEPQTDQPIYSVKEKVVEDLKKLKAMQATKTKAQEFVNLVAMDDWDKAVRAFETLYGRKGEPNEEDPNTFRLQNRRGLRRTSKATLEALAVQWQGDPVMSSFLNDTKRDRRFVEQLYALIPPDSNTVEALPVVMEFKPQMSYFVVKDISIQRLWKERYEQIKTTRLFQEEHAAAQSLAAVHFNPENILKRVNFKLLEAEQEPADANAPGQSEAGS